MEPSLKNPQNNVRHKVNVHAMFLLPPAAPLDGVGGAR
jgi:hypothetical protein